jgi:hypothetical protein
MPGVSRPLRIATIAVAVLAFLTVSAILARWLQLENVERNAVLSLLQAQARGDAPGMLSKLDGCRADPACRTVVQTSAQRLRGPGDVKILAYDSRTSYTLTSRSGRTRVAWKLPGRLADVQCVLVQRHGNAVTGLSVTLRALSLPIPRESDC